MWYGIIPNEKNGITNACSFKTSMSNATGLPTVP